jgi:hypothetical protein
MFSFFLVKKTNPEAVPMPHCRKQKPTRQPRRRAKISQRIFFKKFFPDHLLFTSPIFGI